MSAGASAFARLHETIQEVLYRKNWSELRDIQVDTIHAVEDSGADIVIAANTASGKTEAAFLPVLSRIAGDPGTSIRVLYVSPLKALINDQFSRIEDLCHVAKIPVHRWHGDVTGAAKKNLVKRPSGILLITPESIESILLNRSSSLRKLFVDLEFVVLDEIHAFMGTERGVHLQSLLNRIEAQSSKQVRRIGLSATLGEMKHAQEWLVRRGNPIAILIEGKERKSLKLRLQGFLAKKKLKEDDDLEDHIELARHLLAELRGTSNLVFANRKADLELYADLLNRLCREAGFPEEFLVHHGSLSKEIREHVEKEMRGTRPHTTLCSNTLELGIDVGALTSVAQIDPPFTVSALQQRMGRSGRGADKPSILRFYLLEEETDSASSIWERIYPRFLQSVAMVELLLENWCETPRTDKLHYSTLVQQVLSMIKQMGGVPALALYKCLAVQGPFRISESDFGLLLRALGKSDLIEQVEGADLILGLAGEKITAHYDFYSAFTSPEEYSVVCGSQRIGQLPVEQGVIPGIQIILAAKRWLVTDVLVDQKVILVERCSGAVPPRFLGGGGDVDDSIRERMRTLLLSDVVPSYLDAGARDLLSRSRDFAKSIEVPESMLLATGGKTVVFPWIGDRKIRTLKVMLGDHKIKASTYGVALECDAPPNDVMLALREVIQSKWTAEGSISDKEMLGAGKYDRYLPKKLLAESIAINQLDVEGTKRWLRDVIL